MNPWEVPTAKVGAGALIMHDGQVLLVQINYSERRGRWILPGGKVEHGETIDQALLREVREETSLDVALGGMVLVRHRLLPNNLCDIYFVFLAHLRNPKEVKLAWPQEEIIEARFWNPQDILNSPEVPPTTRFAVRKALSAQAKFYSERPDLPDFPESDFIFAGRD